jgi:type IX secretion system PorP/SprF family membrane protein
MIPIKRAVFIMLMLIHVMIGKGTLHAQDIHSSQFWTTPLLQNPALAGATDKLQANLNYKNEWNSVASPFKTYNLSVDMQLKKKEEAKGFFAGGIAIYSDKAGDINMKSTEGMISAAYHLFLNKRNTLGAGVMGGFAQRTINDASLQWMNQYNGSAYDPSLPTGEPSRSTSYYYADLGAGVNWTYKKREDYITDDNQVRANVGVSVFHPHQPDYSFYSAGEKLYMKIITHGNLLYEFKNTNTAILPGYMFSWQGSATELLFGSLCRYSIRNNSKYISNIHMCAVSLGLYCRNLQDFIPAFFIEIENYTVGFSYDLVLHDSVTPNARKGGIEISLRFVSPNPFVRRSVTRI